MKRAAIYARVSTDIQAEMGYSLPTQLEACRKYAQANGFTVAAELADDCSGSIPVAERPQGRRLYELVDSGQL
jgi:site-specific DNA recombinase